MLPYYHIFFATVLQHYIAHVLFNVSNVKF
nr:MAG TPA: Decoration protein T5 Decoration Protein, Viral [Caudoviricetes sp.]